MLTSYSRKPVGLLRMPESTALVTVAALGVSSFCKSCIRYVSGTTVLYPLNASSSVDDCKVPRRLSSGQVPIRGKLECPKIDIHEGACSRLLPSSLARRELVSLQS